MTKKALRNEAVSDDSIVAQLRPDSGWADELREWFLSQEPPVREDWNALLRDAAEVLPDPPTLDWKVGMDETGLNLSHELEAVMDAISRLQLNRLPLSAWRERMARHCQSLGTDRVAHHLARWLLRVPNSRPGTLVQRSLNRELLRGLLWLCTELPDGELIPALQHATRFFYRKNSPLAVAGVVVLYQVANSASAAALATIAQGLKAESQRLFLHSACTLLAEKLGVDPDELGASGIPSFGFTELGRLTREFGAVRAELKVGRNRTTNLTWSSAGGKVLKSIPGAVRREHLEEVESLKAASKGVTEALNGLALRLESSWLARKRLLLANWRDQLIDHFVAGVIGRRLIWRFDDGQKSFAGYWRNHELVDCNGHMVGLPAAAAVTLWHPLDGTVDQVMAWRERIENEDISQPFKQAHREMYILTDAEKNTRTYSNRFASHIIRQAQFKQLAKSRGWKVGLAGHWDGGEQQIAERKLPPWGLRGEFWVRGTGTEHQTGYTYVSTDQVRFYPHERGEIRGESVALETIPPLVFSEIMRDVDLFVGVASVGNDPNWADGGPGGQYRDYWHSYSFGELSATAQTREALLERLIPRLKIADRCTLADRFLRVRGSIRTYKIHLGSGNILMEPNDQYLCIVPKQAVAGSERVHLPFEGDATLSIILSKAFLLADDARITDPSIVSQLRK